MDQLLQQVERLAEDYYKKYISKKTSLVIADVLEDILIQQGIEVIYLRLPKLDEESRLLNGMFLKHVDPAVQPKIVINQLDSARTQNFTLAHEWFHYILESEDLKKYDIHISSNDVLERAGDYFAATILMNKDAFISYFEIIGLQAIEKKIYKLADIFKVPYVSVVRRIKELGLWDVAAYGDFTEEQLVQSRIAYMGESLLDTAPKRKQFEQLQEKVIVREAAGTLSSQEAAKILANLNPALAQTYYEKSASAQDIDALWDELDD